MLHKPLFALAGVVVLLTGWEVWTRGHTAEIMVDFLPPEWVEESAPHEVPATAGPGVATASSLPGLVALDTLLKLYEQRNPFNVLAAAVPISGTNEVRRAGEAAALTPWIQYLKAHVKLKGLSRLNAPEGTTNLEAIVADNKTGKLLFLRKGDDVLLDRSSVKVEAVTQEGVTVTDGIRRTVLK